jgi:hypothetical protein
VIRPSQAVGLALPVLLLTFLSFFQFPGHTILQSDTQVYIPILEHIWDPTVLSQDFMATRPHVSFTLYDEIALTLRAVTRASFECILMTQQFTYRFIGIAGLYFLATALGLVPLQAMLVAAVVSLGATIAGPAVLTVEYEPVPRGFAFPFLIASLAAVGHGRWRIAAVCATIAFGFHPPTAVAYCGLLLILLIVNRRFRDMAVLAIGPAIILLTIGIGPAPIEPQPLLGYIDPALEKLQRLRGSYNWVSIWLPNWKYHYVLVSILAVLSLWRLWERLSSPLRLMFAGLPLIGILSVPVSYLLLEKAKWIIAPQFQPGRYVLFVTFTAALLSTVAAVFAAERRRWAEALFFFIVAFAIPMDAKLTNVLAPVSGSILALKRLALAVVLAALGVLAVALKHSRGSYVALAAAPILPFFLIPSLGQVRNYAALHNSDLDNLAQWARNRTPKDAVFQFADAGQDLAPGVFRARATRALFVDWKAGGQVNFHKQFSELWWKRWQVTEELQSLDRYREEGIDYVVFKAGADTLVGATPVYSNSKYAVFKVQ